MSEITKVVLDAMGGDNSPGEMVIGAVNAVNEKEDLFVYIVGKSEPINEVLSQYEYPKDRIEVVDAPDEITCHDAPAEAIKNMKNSSMVVGLNMVKEGKAEGIVSAGNSGALLVGGKVIVKTLKGVRRTPLAPVLPTMNDGLVLLIDCGANVDARPTDLVQFAQMGSVYMENVLGIENPRVAIVNIGAEEEKGNALVKETFPLLKECKGINFVGSIEAREFLNGAADVVVTEAFVGNVMLKLTEGLATGLMRKLKGAITATPISTLGAALVKPQLKGMAKMFDTTEYGGAPLLGLNGLVVKIHGNATRKEVKNALFQVETFKKQDISGKIKENLLSAKKEEA